MTSTEEKANEMDPFETPRYRSAEEPHLPLFDPDYVPTAEEIAASNAALAEARSRPRNAPLPSVEEWVEEFRALGHEPSPEVVAAWHADRPNIEALFAEHEPMTEEKRMTEMTERGVFLPLAEQFTELDCQQVELVAVEKDGQVSHRMKLPDGTSYDVDQALEKRVSLLLPGVASLHETQHLDCTVPYCEPCVEREHFGWAMDQDYARIARGRLRRYLMLHRQLPETVRAPEVLELEFMDMAEVLKLENVVDLVAGVLPPKAVGILRARDAMGKSFLALDLAMHVAVGEESWHGHAIEHRNEGRVLYVAGEGAHSYGKRIAAWLEHHEYPPSVIDDELLLRPGSVNLFTGGPEYDRLHALVRTMKPELVIIDTLQTNTAGADHNSATDMGIVMDRLRSLRLASGGTVLVLAHTGKSDNDTRGSSAIEDDSDFVMHVDTWEPGEKMVVKVTKMKDGELSTIDLGVRKVGESLVITDKAPGVVWKSSDLDNRIAAVLRGTEKLERKTAPQILATLNADPDHPQVSRRMEYTLNDMVAEGRVLKLAGRPARYELNESWVDPMSKPDVDPFATTTEEN